MTQFMQAVEVNRLGVIGNGSVDSVPIPVPGPGEVLVRVAATPVNLVDVITITGNYQFSPTLPYTPGKGPTGRIQQVGPGVTGLHEGARVVAMCEKGGYAEYALARADDVYELPDSLSFEAAAAMSVSYETGYLALTDRAALQPDESVLVLGAGSSVGAATLQLARALGAGQIIAGVRDVGRADSLRAHGATDILSLAGSDLYREIRERIAPITDGRGVDVLVDTVGGDVFDGAIRCVAWRGRAVIVGFASGRIPQLAMNYPLLKNISISGLQISDYRRKAPAVTRRCFEQLFALYESGAITPPPYRSYPLTGWETAMHAVEQRTHPSERALITP